MWPITYVTAVIHSSFVFRLCDVDRAWKASELFSRLHSSFIAESHSDPSAIAVLP